MAVCAALVPDGLCPSGVWGLPSQDLGAVCPLNPLPQPSHTPALRRQTDAQHLQKLPVREQNPDVLCVCQKYAGNPGQGFTSLNSAHSLASQKVRPPLQSLAG